MVKRRRLDSGDEFSGSNGWEQQQSHSHHQQPPPQDPGQGQAFATIPNLSSASSFGESTAGSEFANNAATGASSQETAAAATALTDSSTTVWQGSATSYPDVSTYSQQPYYSFQHSDPSTYTLPWPPADAASYGSQASNYSVTAPAGAMPYFPPPAGQRTSESDFETANALPVPNYHQDVEPSSSQRTYSQSQSVSQPQQPQQRTARSDVRGPSSALYFEDASMHLKIQSLSILENLVCPMLQLDDGGGSR